MSKHDDGGPAFPGFESTDGYGSSRRNHRDEWETYAAGMTMRDYFAKGAMQGAAADRTTIYSSHAEAARDAYLMADAMLAERAKVRTNEGEK